MMPPALFQLLALRELTLGDRIAASPMTQYSGEDGCPVPWHHMHVGSLATSGAGLVIMEVTAVEPYRHVRSDEAKAGAALGLEVRA